MSGAITPPKPGELITVTFVTSILDKLNELEGRVAALEKPSATDSSIIITVNSVNPPAAYDPTTNTIHFSQTVTSVAVGLSATFSLPGTYDVSVVQVAPATNWTVALDFNTPSRFTIAPAEIPPGGQIAKTPKFFISSATGVTAGSVEFHTKREGAPNDQFISFKLALS